MKELILNGCDVLRAWKDAVTAGSIQAALPLTPIHSRKGENAHRAPLRAEPPSPSVRVVLGSLQVTSTCARVWGRPFQNLSGRIPAGLGCVGACRVVGPSRGADVTIPDELLVHHLLLFTGAAPSWSGGKCQEK